VRGRRQPRPDVRWRRGRVFGFFGRVSSTRQGSRPVRVSGGRSAPQQTPGPDLNGRGRGRQGGRRQSLPAPDEKSMRAACRGAAPLPPARTSPAHLCQEHVSSSPLPTTRNQSFRRRRECLRGVAAGRCFIGLVYLRFRIDAAAAQGTADLSITKTADQKTVKIGETITYTITLTNLGPDEATDVVFGDPIPIS
jgi:uncharacterized repeat protein (TIGR01451 family)